jgi:glycosyltransferase involved in cell wall biosynthesis
MKTPIVSVVIITYNHEKYIRQCLEGVLMQKTDFPIEVIVGEDCSTDNTRSIIKEFEAKYPDVMRPIYHETNVGGARNAYEFCYAQIKGKYVATCEGDDYWTDPNKLQKQVDFLEQHPEIVMCFHPIHKVDQNGNILRRQQSSENVTFHSWQELFTLDVRTLSMVFRNCITSIPKEIIQAKCCDAFLRGMLSLKGGTANLGFIGGHYRKHPTGAYSSKKLIEQIYYTIHTRRLMKKSSAFTKEQKKEIVKVIYKKKIFYIIHFIKKRQFKNILKVAFS